MRTKEELEAIQNQILNELVNTDDEKASIFYKAQVRILTWVLSDEPEKPIEPEIPVQESTDDEQEVK